VLYSQDSPEIRKRNDRLAKANQQVKTSGGNTVDIKDVAPAG
jgi:hypothetical protein